jgi:hypothetical protein
MLGASALTFGIALASAPALAQWGNDYGSGSSANPRVGPGNVEPGSAYGVPSAEPNNPRVPAPQFWIADASLFIANAQNTANVLAMEQSLNMPAPEILSGQARLLTQTTNRAVYSLLWLQQNAESTNPRAVPAIRAAVGQLAAAQAQASRLEDAAASGALGPSFEVTVRSALGHIVIAQRWMSQVGAAFGVPQLASVGTQNPAAGGMNLPSPYGETNAR